MAMPTVPGAHTKLPGIYHFNEFNYTTSITNDGTQSPITQCDLWRNRSEAHGGRYGLFAKVKGSRAQQSVGVVGTIMGDIL